MWMWWTYPNHPDDLIGASSGEMAQLAVAKPCPPCPLLLYSIMMCGQKRNGNLIVVTLLLHCLPFLMVIVAAVTVCTLDWNDKKSFIWIKNLRDFQGRIVKIFGGNPLWFRFCATVLWHFRNSDMIITLTVFYRFSLVWVAGVLKRARAQFDRSTTPKCQGAIWLKQDNCC